MTSVVVLVGAGSIGQAIARRTRGCPSGAMARMDGPGRACPAAHSANTVQNRMKAPLSCEPRSFEINDRDVKKGAFYGADKTETA